MNFIAPIIFIILLLTASWLFAKKMLAIRKYILAGQPEDLSDQSTVRWKNMLLLAMGQKKMFKNIPVAIMHFIIYAGFIIINIEVLEIVLDGITGSHRILMPYVGSFYTLLINTFEILAALIIVVCAVFLIRRNILKLKRFVSKDLDGWPRSDANYILLAEIVLMSLFLIMNATDRNLQLLGVAHYHDTGDFMVSSQLVSFFEGLQPASLILIERSCWWLHIIGILAFLNYLPYSKHLHIILAFPNAYYARLQSKGSMSNMQQVQNEVKYMMQPELSPTETSSAPIKFGARDVFDLSWKNLLDAYSCTECGRCSTACPANQTGKLLSPRKIMMDTRDRLQEAGKNIQADGSINQDGKTLLNDYISIEELRACTTCNACVEACPVSINPMDIILQLRRSLVMEDSNAPAEWNGMFSNIENNFAPWKFNPDDRDNWAKE